MRAIVRVYFPVTDTSFFKLFVICVDEKQLLHVCAPKHRVNTLKKWRL
jgi:hypothetical protein